MSSFEYLIGSASVLYEDYGRRWAPISHLYFSRNSDQSWLVTRHADNVVEDVISRYCPQCASRYTTDDAMTYQNRCPSCFQCPLCDSPLSLVALSSEECVFQCGYCLWRSDDGDIHFVAADKRELETRVLTFEREAHASSSDVFSSILNSYSRTRKTHNKAATVGGNSSFTHHRRRWNLEDLNEKYELRKFSDKLLGSSLQCDEKQFAIEAETVSLNPSATLVQHNSNIPRRVKLCSRRTIRSRVDVDNGRMKILVQPKPNPMEGDSSQKNRASWWIKDSSAVHEVPRVTVCSLPSIKELLSGDHEPTICLQIQNPKDVDIRIKLCINSSENDLSGYIPKKCDPKFPIISLMVRSGFSDTTSIVIGAYEDEFLRDPTDPKTTEFDVSKCTLSDSSSQLLKSVVTYNTAKVWIPISVHTIDKILEQYIARNDGLFMLQCCRDEINFPIFCSLEMGLTVNFVPSSLASSAVTLTASAGMGDDVTAGGGMDLKLRVVFPI